MSVNRISSNTINENSVFNLKSREYNMDKLNEQINTGKKYRLPSENVVDVTQAMTMHTKLGKIDQYIRNIDDAESERSQVENSLTSSIQILQRLRELSIQGANGTLTESDRKAMSVEVDELLQQLVIFSNAKYKDDFLFSGFQKFTQPFEIVEGAVKGSDSALITQVKYMGDNGHHLREVDSGEYVSAANPGSEMFWADQFQIYSSVNTKDFRITSDQTILIDGNRIEFKAGDNAYAIMDKINRSNASVNASIDMVTGGFVIKSTTPHKIELADIEGGTLLQNLGILETGRPTGPDNYSNSANVFGGSVFDVVIGLRDSFLQNNYNDLGGRHLGSLDAAIENLTFRLAQTGATSNKLTYLANKHGDDKMSYTETLSKLEDVDIAEAVTNLKNLELEQSASLSSLARLSQPTLMDFLK